MRLCRLLSPPESTLERPEGAGLQSPFRAKPGFEGNRVSGGSLWLIVRLFPSLPPPPSSQESGSASERPWLAWSSSSSSPPSFKGSGCSPSWPRGRLTRSPWRAALPTSPPSTRCASSHVEGDHARSPSCPATALLSPAGAALPGLEAAAPLGWPPTSYHIYPGLLPKTGEGGFGSRDNRKQASPVSSLPAPLCACKAAS